MFWRGDRVDHLKDDEIFVFGSNPEGRHGKGAALQARKWGAEYGNGRGLQGQTYALVTKNLKKGFLEKSTGIIYDKSGYKSVADTQIVQNIKELYDCCRENPDKKFLVPYTLNNNNLNGYSGFDLIKMFHRLDIPKNIVFHESTKGSVIQKFKKDTEHGVFSNFWNIPNPLNQSGMTFKTSEHFFMAMKTIDIEQRKIIAGLYSGSAAKKYCSARSGNIVLRSDWEDIKVDVMTYILKWKFHPVHNPELWEILNNTGNAHIQEGNWWNDKIWGVCLKTGEGANLLGETLMKVRDYYR